MGTLFDRLVKKPVDWVKSQVQDSIQDKQPKRKKLLSHLETEKNQVELTLEEKEAANYLHLAQHGIMGQLPNGAPPFPYPECGTCSADRKYRNAGPHRPQTSEKTKDSDVDPFMTTAKGVKSDKKSLGGPMTWKFLKRS